MRRRVAEIAADPALDARTAANMISDLALKDDEIATMWDAIQSADLSRERGRDTINPVSLPKDGPTHWWICPEPDCQEPGEPGDGWAPTRRSDCKKHGCTLVRRPVADARQ
jgi:hypothetical protein